MIDEVCAALRSCRLRFTSEAELQEGLEKVLTSKGFVVEREVPITGASRIDLMVRGKEGAAALPLPIGVEVKIQGAVSEITRQLHRYASTGQIGGLVLATTMMRHATQLRIAGVLGGTEFRSVYLAGTAF